jgi:hypothetical protein
MKAIKHLIILRFEFIFFTHCTKSVENDFDSFESEITIVGDTLNLVADLFYPEG